MIHKGGNYMTKNEFAKLSQAQQELILSMLEPQSKEERLAELEKQAEMDKKLAEDAKKGPYRSFLQVNKDNYKAEAWLMRKSPIAYQILRFIAHSMDNHNALICSYKVMQESLGVSNASIARAIKLLQEHKYLHVAKTGTANIYMVNKELYWHSYGTNYAQAEFGAKIIISADEQDDEYREEIKIHTKRYKAVELEENQNVSA